MAATAEGISSLRTGSLSCVFHVNPENSPDALALHALKGRSVTLEVYSVDN